MSGWDQLVEGLTWNTQYRPKQKYIKTIQIMQNNQTQNKHTKECIKIYTGTVSGAVSSDRPHMSRPARGLNSPNSSITDIMWRIHLPVVWWTWVVYQIFWGGRRLSCRNIKGIPKQQLRPLVLAEATCTVVPFTRRPTRPHTFGCAPTTPQRCVGLRKEEALCHTS